MLRAALIAMLAAVPLAAQGTKPRASAEEYPAHGAVGELTIGAEYLVRSIPAQGGMLYSPAYLVVEAAVFGPKLARATLSGSLFSLRINGSKQGILAQQPFLVANSMEGPQSSYSGGNGVQVGAGAGNGGVILGGPQNQPTLPPGVPSPQQVPQQGPYPQQTPNPGTTRRMPPPETPNPFIPERAEELPIRERVERAALPSGSDVALPVAGALFFAYPGKPEKVKSLELIYEGPAGKLTLPLLPPEPQP